MSYITSGTLQGVTPEFYRSSPFEFETTAATSWPSVVVTTAVPAGSRQITANPPGGGQGEWEPTPLNV